MTTETKMTNFSFLLNIKQLSILLILSHVIHQDNMKG